LEHFTDREALSYKTPLKVALARLKQPFIYTNIETFRLPYYIMGEQEHYSFKTCSLISYE